jgi:hypothetical protein
MEPRKHNDTPTQLKYRVLYRNYGFVNGEWHYIHNNKPLFNIVIELTDDPEIDKIYQEWLNILYDPLRENF